MSYNYNGENAQKKEPINCYETVGYIHASGKMCDGDRLHFWDSTKRPGTGCVLCRLIVVKPTGKVDENGQPKYIRKTVPIRVSTNKNITKEMLQSIQVGSKVYVKGEYSPVTKKNPDGSFTETPMFDIYVLQIQAAPMNSSYQAPNPYAQQGGYPQGGYPNYQQQGVPQGGYQGQYQPQGGYPNHQQQGAPQGGYPGQFQQGGYPNYPQQGAPQGGYPGQFQQQAAPQENIPPTVGQPAGQPASAPGPMNQYGQPNVHSQSYLGQQGQQGQQPKSPQPPIPPAYAQPMDDFPAFDVK